MCYRDTDLYPTFHSERMGGIQGIKAVDGRPGAPPSYLQETERQNAKRQDFSMFLRHWTRTPGLKLELGSNSCTPASASQSAGIPGARPLGPFLTGSGELARVGSKTSCHLARACLAAVPEEPTVASLHAGRAAAQGLAREEEPDPRGRIEISSKPDTASCAVGMKSMLCAQSQKHDHSSPLASLQDQNLCLGAGALTCNPSPLGGQSRRIT
ncbi:uncharacterized protein [Symphalangus syndactylus]|uniref:uncharacterized protein n=1 Tax=Symphalangus syndactylus TaxID=9590 RepID=UPI003006F9F9